jgi:hypothetical protein
VNGYAGPSSHEQVPIQRSRSTGRASPVFPIGDVHHPARERDHELCVAPMIKNVLSQLGDGDTVSEMVLLGRQVDPVWPRKPAAFDKRKRPKRIARCSIPSALWLGGSPRLRALRRSGGVHLRRDSAVDGDEFGSGCQDSIAFFDQLRRNHHLHRHPKFHRTTLCVSGPRYTP